MTLFAQFLARGRQQCRVQWRAVLTKMTVRLVVDKVVIITNIFIM